MPDDIRDDSTDQAGPPPYKFGRIRTKGSTYHVIARDLDRAFAIATLDNVERRILQLVREKTWGVSHLKGTDDAIKPYALSATYLEEQWGYKRTSIQHAVKALVDDEMLTRTSEGLLIQKDVHRWVASGRVQHKDLPEIIHGVPDPLCQSAPARHKNASKSKKSRVRHQSTRAAKSSAPLEHNRVLSPIDDTGAALNSKTAGDLKYNRRSPRGGERVGSGVRRADVVDPELELWVARYFEYIGVRRYGMCPSADRPNAPVEAVDVARSLVRAKQDPDNIVAYLFDKLGYYASRFLDGSIQFLPLYFKESYINDIGRVGIIRDFNQYNCNWRQDAREGRFYFYHHHVHPSMYFDNRKWPINLMNLSGKVYGWYGFPADDQGDRKQ